VTAERRRYWRPGTSLDLNPTKILRTSVFVAILVGLLAGLGMLAIQVSLDRTLGHPQRTLLYSDLFMGFVTAIVTGFGLRHYQNHMRADRARMRMVAEMNHHVRNALTAISLSVYAKNDQQLEQTTREAIQRIDWALREVLPHPETVVPPVPAKPARSEAAKRRSA
jgi:ABC-type bacteriocin/lantibiotic exporter with double-glycine peptidase domain